MKRTVLPATRRSEQTKFPQMQIDYERIRKTMHSKMAAVVICIATFAMSAAAQTVTINNTGTTSGTVPLFTGTSTIGNSAITELNGNVGIGTTIR